MSRRSRNFTMVLATLLMLAMVSFTMPASAAPTADTIVIMLWGDEPIDYSTVIAEYDARTRDTLNTKVNIIWTPLSDYGNKLKLKLAAGEQVDACFDAQWVEMINFISQGNYVNLDPYFESGDYPGLNKAFDEVIRDNNRFSGHVYGFPLAQAYGEVEGLFIRKDLREKYGLDPLETLDDLTNFYDLVLANEPGMVPYAVGQNATIDAILRQSWWGQLTRDHICNLPLGAGMYGMAVLNDDETAAILVTPQYGTSAVILDPDPIEMARAWYEKGYMEREAISQQDPDGLFSAGKAASIHGDTANFYATARTVADVNPGASVEFFVNAPEVRDMKPGAIISDFQAWNFICIPITSTKVERTLGFFDWLWGEQANHDLFELGVEGVHWIADGDNRYSIPENDPGYRFLGYTMTWNPNYIRYPSDIDDATLAYLLYRGQSSTYTQSALTGFTMDTESIKTELAKVVPVMEEMYKPVLFGMIEDPEAAVASAIDKANGLGLKTILDEAVKQIDAFLAAKQ